MVAAPLFCPYVHPISSSGLSIDASCTQFGFTSELIVSHHVPEWSSGQDVDCGRTSAWG